MDAEVDAEVDAEAEVDGVVETDARVVAAVDERSLEADVVAKERLEEKEEGEGRRSFPTILLKHSSQRLSTV